jgi:hypothetical protein
VKRRILGWVLVVIGMAGLIAGVIREGGVNLLWGFVAIVGAGLVGPWPWLSKTGTQEATSGDKDESQP